MEKDYLIDSDTVELTSSDRWMPKYYQIYEYLHQMIVREQFKVGDKLPTEMELAATFNVSRMTAKKALDKLVIEGMVVRKKGRGTFVTRQKPQEFLYNLDITTGFFKDIRSYGYTPTAKTIEAKVTYPSERIATLLDLKSDEKVLNTLKVFYVDEDPIMIENNYMSHSKFGALLDENLDGLRYPLLKRIFGVVPYNSNQTFTATLADSEQAKIFNVEMPFPCIELEFLVFDNQSTPIELGYYTYRSDRYRFNINSIAYVID